MNWIGEWAILSSSFHWLMIMLEWSFSMVFATIEFLAFSHSSSLIFHSLSKAHLSAIWAWWAAISKSATWCFFTSSRLSHSVCNCSCSNLVLLKCLASIYWIICFKESTPSEDSSPLWSDLWPQPICFLLALGSSLEMGFPELKGSFQTTSS